MSHIWLTLGPKPSTYKAVQIEFEVQGHPRKHRDNLSPRKNKIPFYLEINIMT